MPFVIVARVEGDSEVCGLVCQAHVVRSNDGLEVHVVEKAPFVARILRNPGWTGTAWTYQLEPMAGGRLDGASNGPYADLSKIKDVVENYTGESCAIRVSG